jgi:hypothetical protein
VLQSADTFAKKLEEGEEIHCPACGQPIAADDFKAHVEAERQRLGNIIAVFDQRRGAVSALIDRLKAMKTALTKNELAEWRAAANGTALEADLERIEACDPESYRQSLSEDDLAAIETHGSPVVSAAVDASRDAPPDIADLSRDNATVDAAKSVFEAQALAGEIARVEGLIAFINAVETGIRSEIESVPKPSSRKSPRILAICGRRCIPASRSRTYACICRTKIRQLTSRYASTGRTRIRHGSRYPRAIATASVFASSWRLLSAKPARTVR